MLFNPGKMTSTSRILFEQNIAMTIVGFPATPLLSARARVCISASHTREDLDWALQVHTLLSYLAHAVAIGLFAHQILTSSVVLHTMHIYHHPLGQTSGVSKDNYDTTLLEQ